MATFSAASEEKLSQCDPQLVAVAREAIKTFDFKVLEGYRGEVAQEEAFNRGLSNAHFGGSAHNHTPSRGYDLAPCPVDFSNLVGYCRLGAAMFHAAQALGIKLYWGAEIRKPFDPGHFELR